MTPRWNWDFEDEHRSRQRKRAPAGPAGPGAPAPPPDRIVHIRRRRLAAAAVLALVVLVGVIVIATSSAHHDSAAMAKARKELTGAKHAKSHPASQPENDLNSVVAHVLTYTPFVKEGSAATGDVALTFDDGPGPYTPQVLSVLEHYHVHATFFVVGKMLRYFSASTVRAIEDGDVIGDHTESHPMLAQLSAHDQK